MTGAPTGAAFRALFEAHFSYVAASLLRLGVHHQDVDDVAHDVFVTVHRRWPDYDATRPVRPWVFGVTLRHASDYRRRAHRRREVLGGPSPDFEDSGPGPESEAAARQTRALVLRALDTIDLDKRAVLVMHDIDGMSATDIAEVLEIPVNTVYSRLRVARERFRAAVHAESPEEATP